MNVLTDVHPHVTAEKIYRLLGYRHARMISRQISDKVKRSLGNARPILKPKIAYIEKKIKKMETDSVLMDNDIVLNSKKLSIALKRCNSVTVFLATVGKDIDDTISKLLKENKITDAFIYDAIGSVAVEETVEAFHDNYELVTLSHGEATTVRFSPGYCDWMVQEQKKIFTLLDNTRIDVELNSSCLMTPRKSVSGVFGIGSNGFITRRNSNPCRFCDMERCLVRRSA